MPGRHLDLDAGTRPRLSCDADTAATHPSSPSRIEAESRWGDVSDSGEVLILHDGHKNAAIDRSLLSLSIVATRAEDKMNKRHQHIVLYTINSIHYKAQQQPLCSPSRSRTLSPGLCPMLSARSAEGGGMLNVIRRDRCIHQVVQPEIEV